MPTFQGKVCRVVEINYVLDATQDTFRESIVGEYQYDCNGHMIEEFHPRRAYVNRITYSYNKRGRIVEKVEYLDDSTVLFVHRYKYNKNGQITEYSKINANHVVYERHRYTYDTYGLLTTLVVKDLEHQDVYRYAYDSNGSITEEQHLLDDVVVGEKRYTYELLGRPTSLVFQSGDADNIAFYHSYEQHQEQSFRLEQEIVTDRDGSVLGRYISSYDSQGRLVNRMQQYPDGHLVNRSISYEDENNMIITQWVNTRSAIYGIDTVQRDNQGLVVRNISMKGTLSVVGQQITNESLYVLHSVEYKRDRSRYSYCCFRRNLQHGGYREIHVFFTPNGNVESRILRSYDLSGHIIEEVDGSHRDRYSYDEYDNLVCHSHYENDRCIFKVQYYIEYLNK